jgi:capsular exopolysaccharide synthesis family protein
MSRTFDALEKAEKQKEQAGVDVTRMFEPPPVIKRKAPLGQEASARMTEEYNRLRQGIVAALPQLKTRALLFTSSTAGEEAATVLADFGRVLARSGERVLLVDADLRGPMLNGLFGMDGGPGVSQLFSGKDELLAVMKRTETEGLFLVSAGNPVANPFSLFESAGINAVIESMRNEADWILLTAPPVNAYNDAIALAKKVDGVVLVVEAEQTRWEVARSAKERLEDARANILGVVLNNRKLHIPGWIYRRL